MCCCFPKNLFRVRKETNIFLLLCSTLDQGCQMAYFQTKMGRFGQILEGLAMEDVGTLYGHLVYFTAIWYSLWPFGIFCGYFVYFFLILIFAPRKIWQPCF
jgi:hypothetical protein